MIYIVEHVSQSFGWVGACVISIPTSPSPHTAHFRHWLCQQHCLSCINAPSIKILLPASHFLRNLHSDKYIHPFNLTCISQTRAYKSRLLFLFLQNVSLQVLLEPHQLLKYNYILKTPLGVICVPEPALKLRASQRILY